MKERITIGIDMGDKKHNICILDTEGHVTKRTMVANTSDALKKYFGKLDPCLIALEAGTCSGWISRLLEELGHEVLVGNPRKLRVIWDSDEKCDDRDAEMLARIARFDPQLLYPIHHRGQQAQSDLAVIKARDMLVKTRKMLISHARGVVKTFGERISPCSTESFHLRLREQMPKELEPALEPLMKSIEELTTRIRHYDKLIAKLCRQKYPETERLRAISGVGPVTSLAFILTLEEHSRFKKSRDVGPLLGLVPKRDQSGQSDKQLGITKAGDTYLRSLLVGSAQYILGPFGPECDLKEFGLKLAAVGGKNAKHRAVVATARKLAVLMHKLWASEDTYDPFHKHNTREKTKKAA
ncbi:MAG: IS110 family transposase [Halieaceae bacterium]|jgi:transposase|nr:IS110 family transposase [Halieaceae bacterium]